MNLGVPISPSAAHALDEEVLSKCFADDAEEEFAKLKNKESSEDDRKELAAFVGDAEVGDETKADKEATVHVRFKGRDEEINLVDTDEGWKIVGF